MPAMPAPTTAMWRCLAVSDSEEAVRDFFVMNLFFF
jgi:hypothetical protein